MLLNLHADVRSPDTPDSAMIKRVLGVAGVCLAPPLPFVIDLRLPHCIPVVAVGPGDWIRNRQGNVVQVPKGVGLATMVLSTHPRPCRFVRSQAIAGLRGTTAKIVTTATPSALFLSRWCFLLYPPRRAGVTLLL